MLDLFTRGLILFTSFLTPNFNNSITILISSPLQNYLPQVTKTEAFEELILLQYSAEFIIELQFCYFEKRRLHHFCVALTVARKFRLCLQPRGLLRVQSLHLPISGLARRFLPLHYNTFIEKKQYNLRTTKQANLAHHKCCRRFRFRSGLHGREP